MPYLVFIITFIAIWIIIALGFQLSIGGAGMINLAYIAFMAIGAYTFALLTTAFGIAIWFAFLIAFLAPIPLAFLFSYLTVRVKGDYLVIMSFWLLLVVYSVLLNWQELTRGALGIPGIPRGSIFALPEKFVLLAVLSALISFLAAKYILSSPFGRVMAAVRDDELGAQTLGKDTLKVKRSVYLISALYASLGGILLAMFLRFIDPGSFYIDQAVLALSIVIVGGLASLEGTIVASVVLLLLPEAMRFLSADPDVVGAFRQGVYALLLLGIILYRPKGFFGKITLD